MPVGLLFSLFFVDFKLSAIRKPIAIVIQKSDKTQF